MSLKRKWITIILAAILTAIILISGCLYILNVQNALWNKAVTDILEVTVRGGHALDTYVEKDMETLHLLAADLREEESSDAESVQNRLNLFNGAGMAFVCVNLSEAYVYREGANLPLTEGQLASYLALEGSGVRKPFFDDRTGVRTFGNFERFEFADGKQGLVQKTQPLAEIAERFSISFYEDTGFSYVVDREGDILIRSRHRNSNRTFQNLFDIIDFQDNDAKIVDSFREALKGGKKGVARFHYQDEDYVFCYVPMQKTSDWYLTSIIPNGVIMKQAVNIVQQTQIWFVLIFLILLSVGGLFFVFRKTTRHVLAAEEEARRAAESANSAKSRFLSQMSHDIRTPMNAIICMTQLALEHTDDPEKLRNTSKTSRFPESC